MAVASLPNWLRFVAGLRLLAVYIGLFNVDRFRTNLFSLAQSQVSDLYGRTFATWTGVTCVLCILCANNPRERGIYDATLMSFVIALAHFSTELNVFQTQTLKDCAPTIATAGISVVWMLACRSAYLKTQSKRQ